MYKKYLLWLKIDKENKTLSIYGKREEIQIEMGELEIMEQGELSCK